MEKMIGFVIKDINKSEECVEFITEDYRKFVMEHQQDCCESVYLAEVIGELEDLIGRPLTMAEEVTSSNDGTHDGESYTWTFYKFATIKGFVTLRWLGESNGYYSESVDFFEKGPGEVRGTYFEGDKEYYEVGQYGSKYWVMKQDKNLIAIEENKGLETEEFVIERLRIITREARFKLLFESKEKLEVKMEFLKAFEKHG